ncbi:hypothetical protein [Zhihengliuella sp.]|uniref:hypothetical protein n=1 Tax=Zhihengliuella sp. TaxID=1954483 RepID=UPI002810ADC2|nr:hypothetical protein [Zhihengliuella sp.]
MKHQRTAVAALIAAAALTVAGCSSPAEEAPAPSPSPAATASADATDESVDRTDDVKAAAGDTADLVTTATETEPGRLEIETTITDPRSDGSAEAQDAIAICEAAAGLDDVTYVNVLEADGTSFVLFGHPAVAEGECVEY